MAELNLLLNQSSNRQNYVFELSLPVDLLELSRTGVFHLVQFSCTFVNATAENINTCGCREKEDKVVR